MTDTLPREPIAASTASDRAEEARVRLAERAPVLAARKEQRDELADQLAAAEAALAAERDGGGDVLGPAALCRELAQCVADLDGALAVLHRQDADDRAIIDLAALLDREEQARSAFEAAAARDHETVAGLSDVFRRCAEDAAVVADRLAGACAAADAARDEAMAALEAVNGLREELGVPALPTPPRWLDEALRSMGVVEPALAALWFVAGSGRPAVLRGLVDVLAAREPARAHGFVGGTR